MVLDMPVLLNTFQSSAAAGEGIGSDFKQKIIIETGAGIVPIGAIIPWAKSFNGVPTLLAQDLSGLFAECDGSVLSDSDSPLDGETLPDLNGTPNAFLRGNSTSGGTGGNLTHNHTLTVANDRATGGGSREGTPMGLTNHEPPYYDVVWLIRIK